MISSYWQLVILAIVGMSACKPAPDSKLKTLDQFAGGNGAYQCQGPYGENQVYMQYVRGIKSEAQKRAVESALSAVPGSFKDRVFLGPIQSYLELTSNIQQKCQSSIIMKANPAARSSIFACPVIENGAAKIYVDSNPIKIRSSLVRALAYHIVDIDGKIELNLSSPTKIVVGFVRQGDVQTSKKYLGALEFLDEVATSRSGDLSIFSHLLPSAVITAEDKNSRREAFFDPAKSNVGARDSFASYFVAEMLDSSFCSNKSREILVTQFPKTFKFFGGNLNLLTPTGNKAITSGFALSGARSQSAASGRATVVERSDSDPIPGGLTDSGKKMYMVQSDGSEIPTTLYHAGDQQFWKSNDGVWKQSNITTIKNGEQSVNSVIEAPFPEWNNPKPSSQFSGNLTAEAIPNMEELLAEHDSMNTKMQAKKLVPLPSGSFKQESVAPFVQGITMSANPHGSSMFNNDWIFSGQSGRYGGSPSYGGQGGIFNGRPNASSGSGGGFYGAGSSSNGSGTIPISSDDSISNSGSVLVSGGSNGAISAVPPAPASGGQPQPAQSQSWLCSWFWIGC